LPNAFCMINPPRGAPLLIRNQAVQGCSPFLSGTGLLPGPSLSAEPHDGFLEDHRLHPPSRHFPHIQSPQPRYNEFSPLSCRFRGLFRARLGLLNGDRPFCTRTADACAGKPYTPSSGNENTMPLLFPLPVVRPSSLSPLHYTRRHAASHNRQHSFSRKPMIPLLGQQRIPP